MPRGNERPQQPQAPSDALRRYLEAMDQLDLAYSLIWAADLQWGEYDAGFLASLNVKRS